ncbi:MAG: Hsp20/alpha crystallin family protein [Planctomycetes bacterium]|nr:Hsp20/alpha crystallin family protein [Planctomycetota bacterium]
MAIRDLVPWRRRESALPAREEGLLAPLHREMDRLFDDFFGGRGFWPSLWEGFRPGAFVPSVDVQETDKEVRVLADLPGLDEKDVQVELTEDGLSIRGEKKSEREEKRKGYHRTERSYGSFERFIPLPGPVEGDKAKAEFKNGVLTVTLPKPPEAQASRKRIEIKRG